MLKKMVVLNGYTNRIECADEGSAVEFYDDRGDRLTIRLVDGKLHIIGAETLVVQPQSTNVLIVKQLGRLETL